MVKKEQGKLRKKKGNRGKVRRPNRKETWGKETLEHGMGRAMGNGRKEEGEGQRAKRRGNRAMGNGRMKEGKGQRAKCRGKREKGKGQRADGKEQRAKKGRARAHPRFQLQKRIEHDSAMVSILLGLQIMYLAFVLCGTIRHDQDEPQWIVAQRLLSALTVPEVFKPSTKKYHFRSA